VGTGASSNAYALQALDFYPNAITIDAGDSIAYHVASGVGGDAHTVSFVPPGQPIPSPGDPADLQPAGGNTIDGTHFVNSGILFGGQVFTLHFPRPGTYRILCLFHEPAMEGTVVVQRAGAPYPHNADYYAHVSAEDRWEDLGAAQQSIALFPFRNGGTTLAAGISPGLTSRPPSQGTVLRFLDSNRASDLPTAGNITIRAGTTLRWVNETSNEPHTVTIVHAGGTDLPNIPPDPAFGGHVFDGTHDINSGTLIANQSFSATFTRPGRYLYGCLYHDNSRMEAWVTVTQ
jgi:plastocyanin